MSRNDPPKLPNQHADGTRSSTVFVADRAASVAEDQCLYACPSGKNAELTMDGLDWFDPDIS